MNRSQIFYATIDKAIDFNNKKGRLVFKGTEKDYEIVVLAISADDPFTTNAYDVEEIVLFLKYKENETLGKVAEVHYNVSSKDSGRLIGPFPYSSEENVSTKEIHSIGALNKVVEALRFEEEIDYVDFLNKIRGFVLALDKEEYLENILKPSDTSVEKYIIENMYNIIKKKSFSFDIFIPKGALVRNDSVIDYKNKVSKHKDITISLEMEIDKIIVILNKDKDLIMKNIYPLNRLENDIILSLHEIAVDIRKNLLLYIPFNDLKLVSPTMIQGLLKSEVQFELEVIAAINAYLIYRKRQLEGTFWDFGTKKILTKEIPEGYVK